MLGYAVLDVHPKRCTNVDNGYEQESSSKLTNQRVSYVFTSSPLSFHARHVLSTSKFQDSYYCILLIFLQTSLTANGMCENFECEYSSLV